jgi:hypothetical protein
MNQFSHPEDGDRNIRTFKPNKIFCMGKNNGWCSSRIILRPTAVPLYVNDLPKTVNDKTAPILFADDTNTTVKSPNSRDFQTNMVTAFNSVNKWFKVNLLSINVDKTHYIQCETKNKPTVDINITCNDNLITTVPKIKFLGLCIHDSLNWNYHIEYIIPKRSSAS